MRLVKLEKELKRIQTEQERARNKMEKNNLILFQHTKQAARFYPLDAWLEGVGEEYEDAQERFSELRKQKELAEFIIHHLPFLTKLNTEWLCRTNVEFLALLPMKNGKLSGSKIVRDSAVYFSDWLEYNWLLKEFGNQILSNEVKNKLEILGERLHQKGKSLGVENPVT